MKFIKLVLVIAAFALVSNVSAQDLKFGHVDVQKLVASLPEKIKADKDLQSEAKKLQDQLTVMQTDLELMGDVNAELLVVGWGGTYGHLYTALDELATEGISIALAHFNYINPLPKNSYQLLKNYEKIVVCELNSYNFV